jgi:hypothetical protein
LLFTITFLLIWFVEVSGWIRHIESLEYKPGPKTLILKQILYLLLFKIMI